MCGTSVAHRILRTSHAAFSSAFRCSCSCLCIYKIFGCWFAQYLQYATVAFRRGDLPLLHVWPSFPLLSRTPLRADWAQIRQDRPLNSAGNQCLCLPNLIPSCWLENVGEITEQLRSCLLFLPNFIALQDCSHARNVPYRAELIWIFSAIAIVFLLETVDESDHRIGSWWSFLHAQNVCMKALRRQFTLMVDTLFLKKK